MASKIVKNQKGQTLIEYLIIVALLGVGSIVIVRSVSQQMNVKFASIVNALGGKIDGDLTPVTVNATALRKKDLRDFARGAVSGKKDEDSNE